MLGYVSDKFTILHTWTTGWPISSLPSIFPNFSR